MARGEYCSPSVGKGRYRGYGDVFYERVNELDAAIQHADHDYVTGYQTEFRPPSGHGFDQSEFVFRYWQPFVQEWHYARPLLLGGKIDRAAALILASWAARYNELRMSAGGSWGLGTNAPPVFISGDRIGAEPPAAKTPWWKIALGAGAVLGVGYLTMVRPRQKASDRRLAEARQLAADVGLRPGMTEEEKDQAFDAYYKKRGYPSYLLSNAPKFAR